MKSLPSFSSLSSVQFFDCLLFSRRNETAIGNRGGSVCRWSGHWQLRSPAPFVFGDHFRRPSRWSDFRATLSSASHATPVHFPRLDKFHLAHRHRFSNRPPRHPRQRTPTRHCTRHTRRNTTTARL